MVRKTILNLIGKPKTFPRVPIAVQKPIGQFRGLKESAVAANHVGQIIAPGTVRKSGAFAGGGGLQKRYNNEWRQRQQQQQQQFWHWNGIRRTTTTWEGRSRREPKRSNAAGALAVLFGVSAVAVLAAPVVSWVNEHVESVFIDEEAENGDTLQGE